MHEALRRIFATTKDRESVHAQIEGGYADKERMLHDLLALLFAAKDTSSHTVASTVYRALKHPQQFAPFRAELDELFADPAKEVTLKDLNDMTYGGHFLKESMRIDPAAVESLNYVAREETVLKGVTVPKGTLLAISIRSTHHF